MTTTQPIELKVEKRTEGRHTSRGLRKNNMIPAVVYGPKMENVSISIDSRDVEKYGLGKYHNIFFDLKLDGKSLSSAGAIFKKVAVHPVSRRPEHVDFYAPDMGHKLRVQVALKFEGRAKGIEEGGFLRALQRTVEVECSPTNIPEFVVVDVTELGIKDTVRVADLKPNDTYKIISKSDVALATIAS